MLHHRVGGLHRATSGGRVHLPLENSDGFGSIQFAVSCQETLRRCDGGRETCKVLE